MKTNVTNTDTNNTSEQPQSHVNVSLLAKMECKNPSGNPVHSKKQTSDGAPTKDIITDKLALSVNEAAELLGVCPKTIYRLIQRGKLRALSALRHKLIPRAELARFLKQELNS